MKTKITTALVAVLGALALAANAQDNNTDGPPQGGQGQRGPGMGQQRPPMPAVVRALDVNHDGVVDADEIANASAALKTLDKNGDGKLTMQELMGPRPQMRGGKGQGRGPGGPGGEDNMPPNGPPPADGNGPSGPPPGDQ
ncbi:MAG TPA: EF-hand domain-containing protein [bacterium]|jgi:hypothetical protein|nr:EF-hand domain-containing protein [bacterium]